MSPSITKSLPPNSSDYYKWSPSSTVFEGSHATKSKLIHSITPDQLLEDDDDILNYNSGTYVRRPKEFEISESLAKPRIPTELDLSIDLHKAREKELNLFFSEQKYEGVVTNVTDDSFWATLHNLTEKTNDDEAEFSIEEVSDEDIKMIAKGSVFYWNIGYMIVPGGQRIGAQLIRFRRLPFFNDKEIKLAKEKASVLKAVFGW